MPAVVLLELLGRSGPGLELWAQVAELMHHNGVTKVFTRPPSKSDRCLSRSPSLHRHVDVGNRVGHRAGPGDGVTAMAIRHVIDIRNAIQ